LQTENDLAFAENAVKEHDIYLWFSYKKKYSNFTKNQSDILLSKSELSKCLDKFLMKKDSKMSKNCRSCDKRLDLNYAHRICQQCFEEEYL